ncbi:hypothetical protein GW755_02095 [bacterium]|nr:hypothetical protein [bacterium]
MDRYVSNPLRRGVKSEYADPYTRESVIGRFENSDNAQDALLKYAEDNSIRVTPDSLPPEFTAKLSNYHDKVSAMENGKRNNADTIKDLDIERSALHTSLASMLVSSGVCFSHPIARLLVGLIHNCNYPGSDLSVLRQNSLRRKFSIGH